MLKTARKAKPSLDEGIPRVQSIRFEWPWWGKVIYGAKIALTVPQILSPVRRYHHSPAKAPRADPVEWLVCLGLIRIVSVINE